jgi:hypothetical protein
MDQTQIREDGIKAALQKKANTANPYPRDWPEHDAWGEGWWSVWMKANGIEPSNPEQAA